MIMPRNGLFLYLIPLDSKGRSVLASIKLTMLARVDGYNGAYTVAIIMIIVCINYVSEVRKMRKWHSKTSVRIT